MWLFYNKKSIICKIMLKHASTSYYTNFKLWVKMVINER